MCCAVPHVKGVEALDEPPLADFGEATAASWIFLATGARPCAGYAPSSSSSALASFRSAVSKPSVNQL